MALMDVTKSASMNPLTRLQYSIEDDFRELIIAFYGDDYKKVLTKGKLLGDEKIIRVMGKIAKIEKDFGIEILKGDKN